MTNNSVSLRKMNAKISSKIFANQPQEYLRNNV